MTSRATSLPEVAGPAASYIDAEDTSGIERGLIRIDQDEDLRKDLKSTAV